MLPHTCHKSLCEARVHIKGSLCAHHAAVKDEICVSCSSKALPGKNHCEIHNKRLEDQQKKSSSSSSSSSSRCKKLSRRRSGNEIRKQWRRIRGRSRITCGKQHGGAETSKQSTDDCCVLRKLGLYNSSSAQIDIFQRLTQSGNAACTSLKESIFTSLNIDLLFLHLFFFNLMNVFPCCVIFV